jgi:hypothetical protein
VDSRKLKTLLVPREMLLKLKLTNIKARMIVWSG